MNPKYYLSILIICVLLANCQETKLDSHICDGQSKMSIDLPFSFTPNDLCDYYSWVKLYKDGQILTKDSSLVHHYCIDFSVDSVEVYASGNGYTIVDTAFLISDDLINIPVRRESQDYFIAHEKIQDDYRNKRIIITTEDRDFELLNDVYNFMSAFNANVEFVDWNVPGRNYRYVYNCKAQDYFYHTDSIRYMKLNKIIDSLRYLELDESCSTKIDPKQLKILPQLDNFNLDVNKHAKIEVSKHYQSYYLDEVQKRSISIRSIVDSLKNGKDHKNIRIAEVMGYLNPQEMMTELVNLLVDTSYVGLANSADLIYWERIESGDLNFYGHGGVVYDDVFTVSGRANHLLYKISGTRLGNVRMYPDFEYLEQLKCRWNTYLTIANYKK